MINDSERKYLIECLASGKDIPEDFKEKLFPAVKREYEIQYAGKMRKSDILADEDGTFAVPLQVEKIYNGKREAFDDGWRNLWSGISNKDSPSIYHQISIDGLTPSFNYGTERP